MSTAKVLSSYRSLLKVARSWHYDPTRADRSLHDKMKLQIKAQYRENKNLVKKAEQELGSLKRIRDNTFTNKYHLSMKAVPDLVRRSNELLSDQAQGKIKKRKWGLSEKLSGLFSSKK